MITRDVTRMINNNSVTTYGRNITTRSLLPRITTVHYNKSEICGAILRNYGQVRAIRTSTVVPVDPMRAYRESRVMAPLIRN